MAVAGADIDPGGEAWRVGTSCCECFLSCALPHLGGTTATDAAAVASARRLKRGTEPPAHLLGVFEFVLARNELDAVAA